MNNSKQGKRSYSCWLKQKVLYPQEILYSFVFLSRPHLCNLILLSGAQENLLLCPRWVGQNVRDVGRPEPCRHNSLTSSEKFLGLEKEQATRPSPNHVPYISRYHLFCGPFVTFLFLWKVQKRDAWRKEQLSTAEEKKREEPAVDEEISLVVAVTAGNKERIQRSVT